MAFEYEIIRTQADIVIISSRNSTKIFFDVGLFVAFSFFLSFYSFLMHETYKSVENKPLAKASHLAKREKNKWNHSMTTEEREKKKNYTEILGAKTAIAITIWI